MSLHSIFQSRNQPSGPASPEFLATPVERYFHERVEQTWRGGHILKGQLPGEHAVLLTSNDYLSLSRHPEIIEAQVQALRSQGHGLVRSAVFRHGEDTLRSFERDLAVLIGAEDAVVCQSGWNANVGLLQSIAGEGTPVYIDMHAHASLWEGITSAGAVGRPFRHNDPQSLARMTARHGPGVVVVDAVYSTSGTVCELEDLLLVSEQAGCVMVVDEAHALGVFGERGEGLTASLGLAERVHFRTASLSKAFAGRGGLVAGSARHMEYFRYQSRPAIFSSGVMSHEAEGFRAALAVITREAWRREQLRENAEFLRERLEALDYPVQDSQCHIVSLVAGEEQSTMVLRDALESRGVFGSVFCAPATAHNRSLVRFTLNAELTREQLERVAAVCASIRHEVGLRDWPAFRGQQRPTQAQEPEKLKKIA